MDRVVAPKGVYAAVATPIDRNLRPDRARFLEHCRWLLNNGCSGLAPLGTTGEANSFGLDTRIELVRFMADSGLPMDRVIVGTGSTSIEDTVKLSEAAIETGVAGLLMLPPFYYSEPADEGLFAYFSAVAKRLAPRRPQIYLYHIPMFTDVGISVDLVGRLRQEFPGLFVGLKDSAGVFEYTVSFLKAFPGFAAFSGTEVFAMRNLIAGGWGCISATTNLTAPVVAHRISGRSANTRSLDAAIDKLRLAVSAKGTISGTKAYLSLYKGDPEWARTMPPNTAADDVPPLAAVFESLEPADELRALFGEAVVQRSPATAA